MTAAVYAVMAVSRGLPALVQLMVAVAVGAIVYLGVALLLDRAFVEKNVRLLLGAKP